MLDVLFATWEGGGNLPPVLGAARRLIGRGHRVRLMSDPVAETDAHSIGMEFRGWSRAPGRKDRSRASDIVRDWEAETNVGGFVALRDRIMCGPALSYARDLVEELQRRPADVVVSNEMLFVVMVGSEASGTPYVLLCPNVSLFPMPGLPPMGLGLVPASNRAERAEHEKISHEFGDLLNQGLAPVNNARAFFGLRPINSLEQQARSAARILIATSPAFDFRPDFLPDNVRYVGPLLEEPSWAHSHDREWYDASRPLVLVGLSSTFQDQLGTISNIAKALAQMPVTGVITLGPALAGVKLDVAPNLIVVDEASHDELMREAALVVSHAGHGTVIRALSHGVPLLCLPMGRDQHDNAARVSKLGAGLTLDRHAAPESILSALRQLIGESRYSQAAQAFAQEFSQERDVADLAVEIEQAAARHTISAHFNHAMQARTDQEPEFLASSHG